MNELIRADLYDDIWNYTEQRLYSDYRWANNDFLDFKGVISLKEVVEEFSRLGFVEGEIEYCYRIIEDVFVDDKERMYYAELAKKMDDEIERQFSIK